MADQPSHTVSACDPPIVLLLLERVRFHPLATLDEGNSFAHAMAAHELLPEIRKGRMECSIDILRPTDYHLAKHTSFGNTSRFAKTPGSLVDWEMNRDHKADNILEC